MRPTLLIAILATGASFACSGGPQPPPLKPIADIKQLMQAAIDPAADVIWEATGSITDANGTVNRRPKNDEEWAVVRNSAIVLTESANLLMMLPRAKDGDEWMKRSQEMMDTGLAAWKAADAKNVDLLFTVGGDVYEACSRCHQQYMDAIKNANR
jgi:hypothetical protein